ncbi:MAG: SpoIVB peptidase [Lachnospiraceae bacterium]|nr:SpoIVB peptidase [Lachnospiraceae bacterium]
MIILLHNWKGKLRRYRIYRRCLCVALALSCIALTAVTLYQIDSDIPSTIYVRADEEQSFELGVPAKAEIVSASEQGKSNIPQGAVTIDLSQPVTVKAGDLEQYQLQVKLFGFLPFKQVGIQVIEDQELIPVGVPIGIYVKTCGILVIGAGEFMSLDGEEYAPAKNILKTGDYIQKLNGEAVTDKDDFIARIEKCDGTEQTLTVERGGDVFDVKVTPMQDQSGAYKLGVWIRDSAQGVGTMTYIDSEGGFGALGHGINDIDTSTLMDTDDGTLYQTEIIAINKGTVGEPGQMTGMIVYSDDKILGDITENSNSGIFGECNDKAMSYATEEPLPIGFKQEIEKGPAQILCTVDGTTRYYDVEITELYLDNDHINRGIELTVTDPELLEITGGIVQGMSGAPIIQNGKFIGAVTHVLVQDSTRGYGIFIENMLEH